MAWFSHFRSERSARLNNGEQRGYGQRMGLVEAGLWGFCGGAAAGLVSLALAITKGGHKWPWRGNPDGPWPRICVYAIGVIVGMVVAAAAHSQMTGGLPALLMGASAPSVIKGGLSKVEVEEKKPATVPVEQPGEGD